MTKDSKLALISIAIGGLLGSAVQLYREHKLKKKIEEQKVQKQKLDEEFATLTSELKEIIDGLKEDLVEAGCDPNLLLFIDEEGNEHLVHMDNFDEFDEAMRHSDWHFVLGAKPGET